MTSSSAVHPDLVMNVEFRGTAAHFTLDSLAEVVEDLRTLQELPPEHDDCTHRRVTCSFRGAYTVQEWHGAGWREEGMAGIGHKLGEPLNYYRTDAGIEKR